MPVGTPELLICAAIALIVLGPERIPQAARMAGRAMRELRSISSDLTSQVKDFVDEPSSTTSPEAQPASGTVREQSRSRTQTPPDLAQFRVIPDSRQTSEPLPSSQIDSSPAGPSQDRPPENGSIETDSPNSSEAERKDG